jgi:hypothetical protein
VRTELQHIVLTWLTEVLKLRRKDKDLLEVIKAHQGTFVRLAAKDPTIFDRIYDYILFPIAGGSEQLTVREYVDRAQTLIGSHVLYIARQAASPDGQHRLLLRICEEYNIPVFAIDDQHRDLLRRACTKLNQGYVELSASEEILRDRATSHTSAAIERVRTNFENLLGLRCQAQAFEPQDVPIILHHDQVILNGKSALVSYFGQLRLRADNLRPLYASLYRFATALDKTSIEKGQLAGKCCSSGLVG